MPHKQLLLIALGVALAMIAQPTIAGFLNPILAPVKLSVT